MKSRALSAIVIVLLILFSVRLASIINAQQADDSGTIPSDLSLDLKLAQQNPEPNQKQLLDSEVKQAVLTNKTGTQTYIKPQDIIAPQAQKESAKDVVHPEQTTSEQVIVVPTQVQVDESGNANQSGATGTESQSGVNGTDNSSNGSAQSSPSDSKSPTVPGTNVAEPNDNAAPSDNSGNPDLPAPSPTNTAATVVVTPEPATSPTEQKSTTPDNSQPHSSPEQQTQPSQAPSEPSSNPAPQDNPAPPNNPATSSNSSSSDNSAPSNPGVQGAKTSQPQEGFVGIIVKAIWDFLSKI